MDTNVLGQNATALAISPCSEENWQFDASAERAASRQAKGLTKERFMLNRQKLIAACCADYRAHFAEVYGKTERLPSAVFEKIEAAVDGVINKALALVHAGNAQSVRRAFAHKANDMKFVLRTVATGEDDISLKEQLFACNLAIGAAEKRLDEVMGKKTPDYDREKALKAQIAKLMLTKQFISGEIAHQNKLSAE